jgi:hypothetical protein
MKVLLVLGGLLLAAVAAVMMGNAATEGDRREPAERVSQSLEGHETGVQPIAARIDTESCADEQMLRRIIREELAAQFASSPASQGAQGSNAVLEQSYAADRARQLAAVSAQLDQHIAAGSISDADMAALQMEIGKLDKKGQHDMLSKLMKALNSGALQGRP